MKKQYDYILIDCMPSLGMLTINVLAAANSVLIPVQAQYLPAKGMEQLLQTISRVCRQLNPKLKINGILLTMPNRKRVIQLNFRVSPEELKIIEEKMEQYGTTNREAFLRRIILEGYVIRFDLPELKEILRLLRYMGNNINQLTRRVHENARIYDEDLADIRKRQDEICEGVRGILSQLSKLSEAK